MEYFVEVRKREAGGGEKVGFFLVKKYGF